MNTKIKHHLDKLTKYFAITVAISCILCGIFLMTVGHEVLLISKIHALALSILFNGYGFFKIVSMHEVYYQHSFIKRTNDYLSL